MEEIFELCDRITVLRDGLSIGTHRIADTSFEAIFKEMVGREIGERYPDRNATIGDVVLEVDGLIGNRFHNVSFDVRAGEIVGFSGLMGAGRTEVMRALFGADRAKAGVVKLNGKEVRIKKPADAIAHGIAFLTEDCKGEGLLLDFSLRENLSLPTLDRRAKGMIISRQEEEAFADGYLKKATCQTPFDGAKSEVALGRESTESRAREMARCGSCRQPLERGDGRRKHPGRPRVNQIM